MTDIDKLRAELRAWLETGVWLTPDLLRALLDHVDKLEKDALDWERWAGYERGRAEAAEAELTRLRAPAPDPEPEYDGGDRVSMEIWPYSTPYAPGRKSNG